MSEQKPMSHREFIKKYPEFSSLPEYIQGVGGRRIRLMEATLADCRAYASMLRSRIRRRESSRRGVTR